MAILPWTDNDWFKNCQEVQGFQLIKWKWWWVYGDIQWVHSAKKANFKNKEGCYKSTKLTRQTTGNLALNSVSTETLIFSKSNLRSTDCEVGLTPWMGYKSLTELLVHLDIGFVLWGFCAHSATRAFVRSDNNQRCWLRSSGVQSAFHFIPKVISGVEFKALDTRVLPPQPGACIVHRHIVMLEHVWASYFQRKKIYRIERHPTH